MTAEEDFAGVVEIEDKSGAMNGKYPLSDEQVTRSYYKFSDWPRSGQVYSINTRYSEPQHMCLDVFLSGKAELKPSMNLLSRFCKQETDTESGLGEMEVENRSSIGCLPADVMLLIFRYFHPIELAHVISRVCGRWYGLCQTPCLWQEIRIFPCVNRYCRSSLRTFLHRFQKFVKKLCIYDGEKAADGESLFATTDMVDVFPDSMPSVTTLDIGRFSNFTIGFARFIIRCFPNLEVLNLEAIYQAENGSFRLIASQGLPRLRKLIVNCHPFGMMNLSLQDLDSLCESRQLQQLVMWSCREPGYSNKISNAKMALSLTWLSIAVHSYVSEECNAFGKFQNLRYLLLCDYFGGGEETLKCIKTLPKLEHLHLLIGYFEGSGLKDFFEADCRTKTDLVFPGTLKYLCIPNCDLVTDAVVDCITANCPRLVSLCLTLCYNVTDVGLTYIIRRLKNLQFLDISDTAQVKALASITPSDLTQLKYLCVRYTNAPAVIRLLNVQRRDLVISGYYRDFVTFEIKDGLAYFSSRSDESYTHAVHSKFWDTEGYCCMHGNFKA